MNEFPRRPIEPLPPPPGSFDAVVKRAKYRRHRRTTTVLSLAVVFLAGIGGGLSIDGGVSGMRDTIAGVVADGQAPSVTPSNSAVSTPKVTPTPETTRKSPTKAAAESPKVAAPPPRGSRKVSGVAVSADGKPIAGLYVYPGRPGTEGFQATAEPVARTAADGSFSLACPGTPVLLSPWRVNVVGDQHRGGAWSATFVGGATQAASAADAPCSASDRVVKTTVLPGSTLTGEVEMPEQCADAVLPLWVWLNGNRALTVRLGGLESGDSYSVSGLPPGQHTIGANGHRTTVTVGGGGSFTENVTFDCDPGSGTESPDPSESPSTPLPTPSDPPTSQPSPTTTSPSGGSSSSSSTGTAGTAP